MKRKQRKARGFFIMWGSRNRITKDGSGSIEAQCPGCKRVCRLEGMQLRNWFTLYFIPVFPTGSAQRFTQCTMCKGQFRANLDEMRGMLAAGGAAGRAMKGSGPTFQDAIALFNSMRETPEDSEKLSRLLRIYLDMAEPKEAVSAGRSYPKAMEVSDDCLSLMSEAFLKLGDKEAAVRHAAAALALNPGSATAAAVQGQAMALG